MSPWLLANAPIPDWVRSLPVLNACLNATAGGLLVLGWWLARRRRLDAHRNVMLSAFGVSVAFLASYLMYHFHDLSTPFRGPASLRPVYLVLLLTHVVLAASVPPLAITTIYLGLKNRRPAHRRIARWTFPIWLYVSVTGVLVYLVLYHVWPESPGETIISAAFQG